MRNKIPEVPFSAVAAKAYEVFMCVMQAEAVPYDELDTRQQAAWEAQVRFLCSVWDHDGEEDGMPDLDAYATQFSPTWMPKRLQRKLDKE